MKKKLLLLLMLIIMPTITSADSISVTCNSTSIKVNESTNCTIKGTTSTSVSSLSSKLSSSGNIKISNISTSSIWQGNGDGGNIDLYTDVNKSGTFAIATFKVTATANAGTGAISLLSTKFYDANFAEKSVSNAVLSIKVIAQSTPTPTPTPDPNPNPVVEKSKLKSLSITPGSINFQSSVLTYKVTVPNDTKEVKISAVAADSAAKVTIPSNLKLSGDTTVFKISVTAPNKTAQTYTITVSKETVIKSSDASLKSLEIDNTRVQFNENLEYTLTAKSDILDMKITLNDGKASYKVYGNKNLNDEDIVLIKVTAEDGTVKNYMIHVNRDNVTNDNNGENNSKSIPMYVFIISEALWILLLLMYFAKIR